MSGTTLDLESLPFPVAYPLSYARDETLGASDRVDNVFFAGYQTIRTAALLLLADYIECSEACPQVSEAIRGLRLPHWKEWVELADTLARFWRGDYAQRPGRESRFPEVGAAWLGTACPDKLRRDGDWPALLKGIAGGHGPAKGPVDALWQARNTHTHGTGTRTGDTKRDEHLLSRLLPLLEHMTVELFPAHGFTLMRKVSGTEAEGLHVIRLHGPHRDRRFEAEEIGEEWASAFAMTGIAAMAGGEAVVVHPFFLPPGPDFSGAAADSGGLLEDLYLLDRVSEKKVVALGVLDERRLPESLAADVSAALLRKRVEFGLDAKATTRWSLADWSAVTAGRLLTELSGRKYFPDFYLERLGVDDTLRRTLGLEKSIGDAAPAGRGRAVLLLGEAGAGKSSLLCRLVDELLEKRAEDSAGLVEQPEATSRRRRGRGRGSSSMESFLESRGRGDVVLYLSGAGAYGGDGGKEADALLCDAVARQGGVLAGAFGSLASLVQRLDESASDDRNADRKVWFILDGLNEADRFSDLLGALDRFLPHVGERPWLRLVVSIRSGAYFERERKEKDQLVHGGAVFRNASCWAQFPTDRPDPFGQKRDVPYLEVRSFTSGGEGAAAYRLRQERGGEKSSAIPYQDLPAGIRSLLLSPLHLHLFHESWAAETRVPPDLDEMGLFQRFLEKLSRDHPGLGERLHVLAEVMLERREALLPVEVAEKWEDDATRRANSTAARLAKLSPVEELVGASILMRPVEEGQGSTRRLVGYRFSHQSLASAVLLGLLRIRLGGRALPTPPELLGWAREASGEGGGGVEPFDELVDAVAAFVVASTKSGDGEAVAILLDLESARVRNVLTNAGLVAYGSVRGSGNVPDAGAQRFWSAFCETAQTGARGIRLFDSSWQAQIVNSRRGFSQAAMEIGELRNVMLRVAASAEPGRLNWKNDLAGSLLGLSELRESFGRGAEAQELAEESLGLMRELVAAEPGRLEWRRDLAVSLDHLSALCGHSGSFLEAQELSEEGLALMRQVVAAEPGRLDWKRTLTVFLDWASSLRVSAGRRQEADVLSEESVAVMRELVAAEPGRRDWQSDLAHSLNGRSYLMESLGRGTEAAALVEESRGLMRELVATEPRRLDWKSSLANCLVRLSCLRNAVGREAEAEDLEESLGLMRELVTAEPVRPDWKSDLTDVLAFLGDLRARAGRDADAKDLLEECLALRRQLVAAEPESLRWRRALAYALDGMGALSARSGRGIEAESFQEESTALMREYVAAAPESVLARRELAAVLVSLGISRLNVGRKAEAEALLEESLALRRDLVASDPGRVDWRNDLSLSLFAASRTRERSGNLMGALAAAQEDLEIVRELLKTNPDCPEYRQHLLGSIERTGSLLQQSGEVEAAAQLRSELSNRREGSET